MAAAPAVPFDRTQAPTAPPGQGASALAAVLQYMLAFMEANSQRSGGSTYTPEELLDFEQVAGVLKCSEKKAREWIESFCPAVVMVGVLPRVRRADLDAAIRRQALPYGDRR